MKTLLALFIVLLASCTAIFPDIDAIISMTARQTFINAGGNSVEVIEANAVAPVRVAANIERDVTGQPTGIIYYGIGTSCEQSWNVSVVGNYDSFWLGNGEAGSPVSWFVTYDAAETQCGPRRCGGAYSAIMDVTTGIATIECFTP